MKEDETKVGKRKERTFCLNPAYSLVTGLQALLSLLAGTGGASDHSQDPTRCRLPARRAL